MTAMLAQGIEVRQAAAGRGLVVVAGMLLAAAVLAGSLDACGAKGHRHGAEGDCKGDCAELGGILQQNRVLLGVATP